MSDPKLRQKAAAFAERAANEIREQRRRFNKLAEEDQIYQPDLMPQIGEDGSVDYDGPTRFAEGTKSGENGHIHIATIATAIEERDDADPVNHPGHYTFSKYEVIDVIEDWGLGFHEANVVKYIARWPRKGGLEDLKKAAWYLARLIENMEAKK